MTTAAPKRGDRISSIEQELASALDRVALLQSLFALAQDFILIVNSEGTILDLNRSSTSLPVEKHIGLDVRQFIPPDHREHFNREFNRVFETGLPARFESTGRNPGETANSLYLSRISPIGEKPYDMVSIIATDITGLRQTEQSLREQETLLRVFCDNASLRMGVIELLDDNPADLRIAWVNRAFALSYKVAAEAARGKLASELVGPEDLAAWMPTYWKAWRSQTPVTLEFFEKRQQAWILATVAPIPGDASAKRLAFVVKDITDRKRAEEMLRESEARFRSLFENSPDAAFVEGLDGTILDVNRAACRLHGTAREELIGKHFLELVPSDQREAARADRERLVNGEIRELEGFSLKSCGRVVPIELTAGPIQFAGSAAILLHVRDISERKAALRASLLNQELERKLLEAQKLESLGVLAGGVAHDFNNLLAVIVGNASMIERMVPPDSPIHAALAPILRTSERAADLCNQMLAYSGRSKFMIGPVDLNEIVREIAGLLAVSIPKKAVLRTDLAPSSPMLQGDATQLRQLVMNLVINAGEAIGERPGVIALRSSIGPGPADIEPSDQPHFILEVADTGCGMDEATRAKIFDPFFTTKFTGRGLGLATVLGVVRGHRGHIEVESQPGRGTTFRVYFPIPAVRPEAVRPITATSQAPSPTSGNILVVDDEGSIRNVLTRMVKTLGFDAVAAADGEEALDRFRESPEGFAMVLLDLTMPRLDGEETLRTLHLMNPNLPVILMSGFSEQETAAKFVGQQVAGFLTKPFTIEKLEAAIRKVGSSGDKLRS